MHFHIITLFPDAFTSYCNSSIIKRAIAKKLVTISFYNPMEYAERKNGRIDDKPYGGGPGMVLEALPFIKAYNKAIGRKKDIAVYLCSHRGKQFDTDMAIKCSKTKHIVLICGHYEGIDARIEEIIPCIKVSVGHTVLTGGELPALAIVDASARFVKGVLGNSDSLEDSLGKGAGKTYTRPPQFTYKNKIYKVPDILTSGHHKHITDWKKKTR